MRDTAETGRALYDDRDPETGEPLSDEKASRMLGGMAVGAVATIFGAKSLLGGGGLPPPSGPGPSLQLPSLTPQPAGVPPSLAAASAPAVVPGIGLGLGLVTKHYADNPLHGPDNQPGAGQKPDSRKSVPTGKTPGRPTAIPSEGVPEPLEPKDNGEVWNSQRGVDFKNSNALHPAAEPGQSAIVDIEYTGSYPLDYAAANKAAGFSRTPKGYTWHHLDNYNKVTNRGTLQLVEVEAHRANPHNGGVAQYQLAKGVQYLNWW